MARSTTAHVIKVSIPVLAAAALGLTALPARAQTTGGIGAHGYQIVQAQQEQSRHRLAPGTTVPAPRPAPLSRARPASVLTTVTVMAPRPAAVPEPAIVAIRGPDGRVRRFPLEGGRNAVVVDQVVVSPGRALSLTILPPAPAK